MTACSDESRPPSNPGTGNLAGTVLISGPLRSATISVDQLDLETGEIHSHVGDTTTDEQGQFSLDTGTANGLLVIRASGGSFVDRATGATIQLDETAELETIVPIDLLEELSGVLVSPIGHLIAARTRYKLFEHGLAIDDAFADATDHLNDHFGNVDWLRIKLADLRQPASSPTEPVRAALVHTALSYLVQDIANEAGASPQETNVFRLTQLWAEDVGAGVFDGNDGNADGKIQSGLQLGVCPPVDPSCSAPPNSSCTVGACRTLCDLYVGTPRALLGGVVTKVISNPEINGTNLATADVLPVARAISESVDDDLFGNACTETLDRLAPTVQFSLDSPADGMHVRGTRTVKVIAIDDLDPNPVARFHDFVDSDGDTSNNVAIATIDTTRRPDGALSIVARASDLAGNMGTAARLLVVDNTAPVVTPSASGFFVDGSTWWTGSATPTLTGTLTEPNPASVKARIGGADYAGTVTAGGFSIALPSGAIDLAGRDVTVIVTDLAGNEGQATRRIRHDATPPSLALINAGLYDELAETVTFSYAPGVPGNHEKPTHAHGGTRIDLGATAGCPAVTKYSYLLGATTPAYVIEQPGPNPILYPLSVTDDGVGITAMSTQYRVIRRGNPDTVVRDWTVVTPTGSPAIAQVGIYDGAVTGLATTQGTYEVEMRASDRLGRTTTIERCFALSLKAPPLHFWEDSGNNSMALDRLTLAPQPNMFETIAERMLNPSSQGASLVHQRFINGSTSNVHLTLTVQKPTAVGGTRQFRHSATLSAPTTINVNCSVASPPSVCTTPGPPNPYPSPLEGSPTGPLEIRPRVYETDLAFGAIIGEIPCVSCSASDTTFRFVVPPRPAGTGAGPRYFVAMTMLNPQQSLYPTDGNRPSSPPYSDGFMVGSVSVTGKLANPSATYCSIMEMREGPVGVFKNWCIQSRTFRSFHALMSVNLTFDRSTVMNILTSPTATIPPVAAWEPALRDRADWSNTETPLP